MGAASILSSIGRNMRNHGAMAAGYDATVRAINRVIFWKTLQCVVVDRPDPSFLTLPPNSNFRRLDAETLWSMEPFPCYELPASFLSEALAKGDECFAILDGSALASYGWYAHAPTMIDDDLRLSFDSRFVYMYKGLTLEKYRGQRLHAIGMTMVLSQYLADGFQGLVSYVESNNFDSLKSCRRMGYRNCGRIQILKLGSHYAIHSDAESRGYGLSLSRV